MEETSRNLIMADVHTQEQRSRNMSAIKAQGNRSTELRMVQLLRRNKVRGWRRHQKNVFGNPDFVFPGRKIAVFIDGCFWHGCPYCRYVPGTNIKFWEKKINNNRKRDHVVNRILRDNGWVTLRIREHVLKKNQKSVLKRINKSMH